MENTGYKSKTLLEDLIGFPDGSSIGLTVWYRGETPLYWTLPLIIYHAGNTKTKSNELDEPNYNSVMLSWFGSSMGEWDSIVEYLHVVVVCVFVFFPFILDIKFVGRTSCRSTPVAQLAPRNLLTRWDVSSIPANGIFLTKN